MKTYFATPKRADETELAIDIKSINDNSIVTNLLSSVSGVLAILNEFRQVVVINDSFLKMLGIDDPGKVLGLRPGEILNCIHSHSEPGGCGTTKFCSTCGAAIAIVSCIDDNKPAERICALRANESDKIADIVLLIRSNNIFIDNKKFVLLFIQDITIQHQRDALERIFFHDINNMLCGLVGCSELLANEFSESQLADKIKQVSLRLAQEVKIQSSLLHNLQDSYQLLRHAVTPLQVMEELKSFYTNHPATKNKFIYFLDSDSNLIIKTDLCLLLRILCNMITNALEASDLNSCVKVWSEEDSDYLTFCVWNDKAIDNKIARRIFQRNFSTKNETGRGIGTYSMKLFGETFLGGKVEFLTSKSDGTTFKISLKI